MVGKTLGHYEIIAPLGAGGMGEVYRARDTKLGRDVAIKVVPEYFSTDPDRLARFEREAKLLASLNHPNIAAIYGLEDEGDYRFIVMEVVEGETLAERVARSGRIGVEEALDIARQVAEALEAAHGSGIIHRDLKPANVVVTPEGRAKVLDFGLAKAYESDGAPSEMSPQLSHSPTMMAATGTGVIMGTAAYMSPEQAKGKPLDKRTDIWSFGCLSFEMLTGRVAFGGEDVSETLAAILRDQPDWSALPGDTPRALDALLRRCLTKDANKRLHDIADGRIDIVQVIDNPGEVLSRAPDRPAAPTAWRRALPVTTAVAASLLTALAVWTVARPTLPAPPPVQRLTMSAPASRGNSLAVSPDGTRVAYVGSDSRIYVRELDERETAPLAGTEGAFNPFFSPNGEWVGFFATRDGGHLRKVPVGGGPVVTLADAPIPPGGSWAEDDTIVFATSMSATRSDVALFQVPASGGAVTQLIGDSAQDIGEQATFPDVLPGGRAVLFASRGGIAALSLETDELHTVVDRGRSPKYVDSGHIVYLLDGTLMAAPFDAERLETTGPAVAVIEGVREGEGNFAVSRTGLLAYFAQGAGVVDRTLVWVDRDGREEAVPVPPRPYGAPRLSPDGAQIALSVPGQGTWLWHRGRETLAPLFLQPQAAGSLVWTPDGERLAFFGRAPGEPSGIYWQPADGTGQAERLTSVPPDLFGGQAPAAFSADGQQLLFEVGGPGVRGSELRVLSLSDRESVLLPLDDAEASEPVISPDGRWLAYHSDASGQDEVYVRPFPDVEAGRWQPSGGGGGAYPVWSPSTQELFYRTAAGGVMAVPFEQDTRFIAGTPRLLFDKEDVPGGRGFGFDVSPDGQRFLMLKQVAPGAGASTGGEIKIALNWFEELKQRVPAGR